MKKKSKKKSLPNPALDLFGQVPITVQEVEEWVAVVAPRWYGSRRMQFYIRDWGIKHKVERAKLSGTFDQVRQEAAGLANCSGCIGRFAKP